MDIKFKEISDILNNIRQKGFFHLLSANLLIQVVGFASQLLVAGILSPEDIGRIKIIQTYLAIFSIIGGMGFSASTLKLCSENITEKEQSELFRSAILFTLISTICLYFIVVFLNLFGVFSSDKLIQWIIPLGIFPVISNSLFMVFVSYFQARKKIKLMSNLTVTNKVISIIAIIVFTYFLGIKGYYIAYNLSFIFMLLICFWMFRSTFSERIFPLNMRSFLTTHWRYAKSSMTANLLSLISAYVDILLLRYFISDMQQIGFYSFALTLIVVLTIIPSTVQQITIPYFSSLANNKVEFIVAFKRYNKILYGIVGIILLGAWLFMPYFIHWIFGGKYDESIPFFMILALGWSIRQLTQLQSGAIFGLGKIHYIVYASLISLVSNLVLFSLALHYFGLIGSAYASIISGIVILFTSRSFFRKARNEML